MADTNSWSGIGRQVLDQYLRSESGEGRSDAGQMGLDVFNNGFEDEFAGDSDDPVAGTYQSYSPEANRALENRPWGNDYTDRPKIHELNQPPAAQALGWRVVDLYPNRDEKSVFHRLAGTPSELRQMLQLIQAMRFVTGARINFEQWFEQWETGFLLATQDRAGGNFEMAGDKAWERIKNPETRPRYREFTTSQQRADWGYRVIEYWRDRSQESSTILAGTDLDLTRHIVQIEYEGGAKAEEESIDSDTVRYSGIPQITLYFGGIDKSLAPTLQTFKGKKHFRYMGYTDNPDMAQKREDLELITQSDIDRMGAKIRSVFGTSPPYNWSKGKKQVIYHDWMRGYNLNVYCLTRAEGERMVATLLQLRNLTIDETFLKYGEAKNTAKAYPQPTTIQILGKSHKTPERLPEVDVQFQYAKIYLPTIKETQYIA